MLKVLAVVYPTHPLIIHQLTCKEILRGRTNSYPFIKYPSASYFTFLARHPGNIFLHLFDLIGQLLR
jgi:hypothetical protein